MNVKENEKQKAEKCKRGIMDDRKKYTHRGTDIEVNTSHRGRG